MLRLRRRARLIVCSLAGWAIALAMAATFGVSPVAAGVPTGHEVCTAAGLAFADGGPEAPGSTAGPSGRAGDHAAGHCAFCSFHADTLAPPPVAPGPALATTGRPTARRAAEAPRTAQVRAGHQARAPPFAVG